MSDIPPGAAPEIISIPAPTGTARRIWIEIAVVCSVAVFPDLVHALQWVEHRLAGGASTTPYNFAQFAAAIVVRSVPAIVVTLFVIARSDLHWRDFGFRRFRIASDSLLAVVAVAGAYLAYYLAWYTLAPILTRGGVTEQNAVRFDFPVPGRREWTLLVAMSVINGFAEEIVMRGFLITQLKRVLGSGAFAVFVTAAMFAGYHAYQGAAGVLAGAAMSIVFGVIFLRTRRFWPLALAHCLMDILGYLWLVLGR